MELAIAWLVIANLLAGGLAFFVIRALYREVIAPNLEYWKKKREERHN
jgi:hypothetical protein